MSAAYYVYYRVQPQHDADAHARVQALFARVAAGCGIAGRLLRKRGEPDLWMEVYEAVADEAGFESALARAGSEVRIDEVLVPGSPRKVECFRGCA